MSQRCSDVTGPDDSELGPVEPTAVEQRLMRGVEHVAGVSDHLVHHPAPNGARAFVNAFFGDRLDLSGSPLAHTMGVRRRGRSVPLTAEGFAAAFPGATGMALCIGASLDFITERQRRAPRVMQRLSIEWVHRLASDPKRMWRRYLLEGPRIFLLAARHRRGSAVR